MSGLAAFFERHLPRAVVEAAVNGRLGSIRADDPTRPRVARLDIGCYAILGGDPDHEIAHALVRDVARPREILYGHDPAWRRLILEVHGAAVVDRPMKIFDPRRLDTAALLRFEREVPHGYALERMDARHARQLDRDLEPHALQVFETPEQFERDGLGFALVAADGTLACAATSYTIARDTLEVAIATRVAHRGRGLAAIASATLMRESLERGLTPEWSASNPVSKRLAERLGYVPGEECEVLYLA